jgi:hypothetical protein
MNVENKVSIWFGKFDTEVGLDAFLEIDYDEDGDSVPSLFMIAFGIDYYDEDFREAFLDNNLNKASLENVSYSETFVDKIETDFSKYNCAILLYDYDYSGEILETENIDFYGVLYYKKQ